MNTNNNDNKDANKKKGDQQTDPIDKPQEVEKSNDEKIDQDFPSYPHYPAKEDIMDPKNHTDRVNANVENVTRRSLSTQGSESTATVQNDESQIEDFDDLDMVEGTGADVTAEDLRNLGPKNRDMDMNEDEQIENNGSAGAFEATEETVSDLDDSDLADELERTGDDLDVPGEELDDANERIGEEDEENNYYSLGGDEMDNLEEDPTNQNY